MSPFISFLTKHWKELLIGLLLLIVSVSWYYDRSSLVKSFDSATERYEKELSVIKDSHAREARLQKEIIEKYQARVKELETVFRETQRDLEAAKDTRAEEVVTLRRDNPELLAKQLEKAFGFEYVE